VSVARAVQPDLREASDVFRLMDLLDRLKAHREEVIQARARQFRPMIGVFTFAAYMAYLSASHESGVYLTTFGAGAVGAVVGFVGFVAAGPLGQMLALAFSTSLKDQLAAIARDQARLIALINEARVAMANNLTEYQQVELEIRLRRLAGP
jgi:hypothetical protein